MTHEHFIELQKSIYTSECDAEWSELFAAYNKKNGTSLTPLLRCDHLVILHAIALKQGFSFHSKDVYDYNPYPIETNYEQREWWNNLYLKHGIKQV